MPWIFLVWLLSFVVQCILLGISLFQLITLTDLEADYVNPYEASNRFNRLVIPEYAIQASIAILSTLTGNWLYGFLNLTLTAYHTHLLLKRQHLVDVTEIFRHIGMKRKQGSVKMVTYLLLFVWALYRLLGVGVRIYMTPEGRGAAKKVMQQQASFY